MPISFPCPNCGHKIKAPNLPGKVVSCASCSQSVTIPQVVEAKLLPVPASEANRREKVDPQEAEEETLRRSIAQIKSMRGPFRVRVSANIIRWPHYCACCFTPASGFRSVCHTRTWGRRVAEWETKEWRIPYCNRCLEHIHEYETVLKSRSSCRTLIWTFAIILSLLSCGAVGASPPIGLILFSFVIFGGIAARYFIDKYFNEKLSEFEDDLHKDCSCPGDAVTYDGWHRSIHLFWFQGPLYTAAFLHANEGKCLSHEDQFN